jgi:hypothetical protein
VILYKIVLFICLVLQINKVNSQTFLGKNVIADIGTTLRPSLLTPLFSNENYFSQWSVFPSSIDFGFGYTPSSRFNFRLEYGIHKPQITGIRFQKEYLFDTINQQFIDSFYLSSNIRDLNFCFRIYQDYAPIGRYFTLFGGWSSVQTRIISSSSYWNITPETYYYESNRLPSIIVKNNAFRAGVGYGRTQLITRYLFLDFGFKASLTYSGRLLSDDEFNLIVGIAETPEFKNGYALEYSSDHSKRFSNGMRKSLLNSYFIEFYMNFGLSF